MIGGINGDFDTSHRGIVYTVEEVTSLLTHRIRGTRRVG